jgi:hypothetical protein
MFTGQAKLCICEAPGPEEIEILAPQFGELVKE